MDGELSGFIAAIRDLIEDNVLHLRPYNRNITRRI